MKTITLGILATPFVILGVVIGFIWGRLEYGFFIGRIGWKR